jgi:hypothetical protein
MGVGAVSYPISSGVMQALARFPNIAAHVQLPAGGRSGREIVRLLDNTHYDHITRLLAFIDRAINRTEPIGHRVLVSQDPFQLNQALAELYLHFHLTNRNCGALSAAGAPADHRKPDLKMAWGEWTVLLEVYNPIGLIGFQMLNRYAVAILKYLEIPIAFEVAIELRSEDPAYPYQIGTETSVRKWLRRFADEAAKWLQAAKPSDRTTLPGPNNVWRLEMLLTELHQNARLRCVQLGTSTFSTDARLSFECGTEKDTARSRWGEKLKTKLEQRQCGDRQSEKLRILVVDFSQADTAWPDFICWPPIAERMDATIRLLVDEIGGSVPYDLVVPAQLGFECCFGPMIVIDAARQREASTFVKAAGLDRPCVPKKAKNVDWLSLLSAQVDRANGRLGDSPNESKPKF